jgi:hypothetical protein
MEESNKLIAEFMGAEWHKDFFKDVCIISPSNISYKFHTSWDWLMPVISKCLEIGANVPVERIYHSLHTQDISFAYKSVVEFIKNQNN